MSLPIPIHLFNPRQAAAETLEALFVGRRALLDELLADFAQQAKATSARQHWLIFGPRGMGKTHLAGLLYHRVRNTPELATRFVPLWLPEPAALGIYSTASLLSSVAEQLLLELGDPSGAREALAAISKGEDDSVFFEEMCAFLKAHLAGRTALLLMENLDALLATLSRGKGGVEARRFRSLLTDERWLLVVSTTPTRHIAALKSPKAPLFGQLRLRDLEPLTEQEVGELMARLSAVTGGSAASLEGPWGALRQRVFHRLTGGSPRAVATAFSALTGATNLDGIVRELTVMLDLHTPYFEALLATLAPRERAIAAAMALSPVHLDLQEISKKTGLPAKGLPTQLKRLRSAGVVGFALGEGGRGTLYEVSDGLFRTWTQYRHGLRTLPDLVSFLALKHPLGERKPEPAQLPPSPRPS